MYKLCFYFNEFLNIGVFSVKSYFHSLMNVLKANVRTGVLALPIAFKYGGLWVSL